MERLHSDTLAILMSTYNGGAYLREQLDSILAQSFAEWKLFIRDDGSSDNTLSLIEEYHGKDRRIMLLTDLEKGRGAAQSYLWMLGYVDAPFYMFCDQDDIWLRDKVKVAFEAIKGESQPGLAYTNAVFYQNGNPRNARTTVIHPGELRRTLFLNSGVQGCAIIINRALADIIKHFSGEVEMHDHLTTVAAASFGKIRYVDQVMMYYRQHDRNVTTDHHLGTASKVRSFFGNKKFVINKRHYEANQSFYDFYKDSLSLENRTLFEAYFQYGKSQSVFARLGIVLRNGFSLGDKKGVLLLKTLIRKPLSE